jgi:hypothetical protein
LKMPSRRRGTYQLQRPSPTDWWLPVVTIRSPTPFPRSTSTRCCKSQQRLGKPSRAMQQSGRSRGSSVAHDRNEMMNTTHSERKASQTTEVVGKRMWKRTLLINDDDDEDVEGISFSTREAPSYILPPTCAKRQKDPRTGPIESGGSTVTQKVPTASKRGRKTIQSQHRAYLLNSGVYTESTLNR